MELNFTCPVDGNQLSINNRSYKCLKCNLDFPIVDGILCMFEDSDQFYEGAYKNRTFYKPKYDNLFYNWPLWVINSGWLWSIKKLLPRNSVILELGCAGGSDFLGEYYNMIGCDLSFSSLKNISNYKYKVKMDVTKFINIKSETVDAVISSYFWEHIPPNIKPKILEECYRVLKPNGKIIFLYDVVTNNPLISKFKLRNPNMYLKEFIDSDSHFGYETIQNNLALFESYGFNLITSMGLEKTFFQSSSTYIKLAKFFPGTYWSVIFNILSKLGKAPLFYPYCLFLRVIDTLLGPFLPLNWARIHLVALKKSKQIHK